jgi:2-polyprenyl-3-methyl-5-hydroxy-6-metoxy-1,4-benzoquinol methylase
MELTKEDNKLSTQSYWDEVLKSAKLPRKNSSSTYVYNITMKYVDRLLMNGKYATFFEVGCGSSGWLPYFAEKYNYEVSGLDYSEVGCELAKKNLELQQIKYGQIFCRDFFLPNPTDGKKYDVVFSYGVIEHFSNPEQIVEIFDHLLSTNGLMITLIPNFNGLMGRLTKRFMPDVYEIHNIITPKQLAEYHSANGLQVIKNGYAGILAFGVMPWVKSNHWLFKENTVRRKISLFCLKALDKALGFIFRILPFDLPSKTFSPYEICIAQKIK